MAILAGGSLVAPVLAQDPDDQRRGVARVSLIHGDASVQRGDSGDWVAATMNTPILTADRIATGMNSRAEVQFDSANVLRMGGNAQVSVTDLEYGRIQLGLARGVITFRVLRSSQMDLEVDTPSVSIRPSKVGAYRIAVTEAGETEVTARSGEVEVFSPHGSQWVRAGEAMMARGSAADPEFQMVAAAPADDWDRWNDSRDQALTRSASTQYVGPGIYGAEDLDPYGTWVNVPNYGYVWQPLVVEGWAPYRQGRWVWEDWYGWTWVSYEPWGWAPYHYGRWFYEPAYGWCWYPGAVRVRHYWAPGLVAFFGFGGGAVSIGFGNVGWVPLAPYEVFHPWWGRGFYGGPAYVNRSISITNVNITNIYRNARVANGVTAVRGTDFSAGRFNSFVRASNEDLRAAGVARGPIPVAPRRESLQFSERPAAFVPRSAANTRFFTKEEPSPAPRVPFAEQRRTFDQPGRASEPAAASRIRVSPPAAESAPAPRGWTRFGEPAAVPRSPASPAAAARETSRNLPTFTGGEPTPPRSEVQNERSSFLGGSERPYQPEARNPAPPPGGTRFGQPGRTESPRIAPPVIRDRPSGNSSGAPRSSGGSHGGGSGSHGGGRTR